MVILQTETECHGYAVLRLFPQLKELEFKQDVSLRRGCFNLPNLENIKFHDFRILYRLNFKIDELIAACPKLKSIDYEICRGLVAVPQIRSFKKYPTLFKVLHWFDGVEEYNDFRDTFLQMENIKIERFYYYSRTEFAFISRVLEAHPQIKEVEVIIGMDGAIPPDWDGGPMNIIGGSRVLPPPMLHNKITSFKTVIFDDEPFSFSPFTSFTSLKKLDVKIFESFCPFGHEIIPNASVKEIFFNFMNFDCERCRDTLSKSFPNVEIVSLSFGGVSVVAINLLKLIQNWTKLKELRFHRSIFYGRECKSLITEPFLGELHPSLKHLEVTSDIHDFNEILMYVPKLEVLKYVFDIKYKFGELSEYLQFLPELKYLLIRVDLPEGAKYNHLTAEEIQKLLTAISEHCKKLKVSLFGFYQ